MMEVFRVVKDRAGLPIRAFRRYDSAIGADMEEQEYLRAICLKVGNPFFVLTNAKLLEKILAAAAEVRMEMQQATVAVAALPLPPGDTEE